MLPDNFWSKTAKADCLVWTGALNSRGYGCFAVAGVSQLAHRIAWEDANGPIPDGMTIDHTCRVKHCVNVDHLEVVTQAENNKRSREARGYVIGGRCSNDHLLTDETAKVSKRGRLICLTCGRESNERMRAERASIEGRAPAADVREWARSQDIPVRDSGRISPALVDRYLEHLARAG
jgi:hypothetical protein